MANNFDFDRSTSESSTTGWLWWVLGVAAILLLLFLIVAYFDTPGNVATPAGDTTHTVNTGVGGIDPTPSIADILANPVAFAGNTVTVDGEVEEVLGTHAFILDEFGVVQDQILVVTDGREFSLNEGMSITVSGMVQSYTIAEVEREFNLDLSEELEVELSQQPVLVAYSVISDE